MVKHIAPLLTVVLTAGIATAQVPPRVYSNPLVPSADALNRLNLKMGWRMFLPVEDSRDGLATVQVMGDRIYVQLRNGAVLAVDADTGRTLWRTRVGSAYKVTQALGFSYDTVFGINGTRLFGLDRTSGRVKYDMDLPNVPTTPPVADAQRVYVCLTGSTLVVYELPAVDVNALPPPGPAPKPPAPPLSPEPIQRKSALGQYYATESWVTTPLISSNKPQHITYTPLATATQTSQSLARGYELPLAWEYAADSRLELPPLLSFRKPDSAGALVLAGSRGQMYGSSKVQRALNFSFTTDAPVSAPMGQYGDIAYIAYEDATLVAMNIENGRLLWRLAVGGVTRARPEATDDDLYMTPDRAGLYRVNRGSGEVIWRNETAQRFLCANRKFVYALDASHKLLILDRARGTQLSSYDIRDFQVAVSNDYTDRLFLAAHNGLLLSLYDRDYATPSWNKQLVEEKRPERRPGAEPKMGKKE